MKDVAILYPVFAQVALTYFLLFNMAFNRVQSMRTGTVVSKGKDQKPEWPANAAKASDSYHNQFELPVLFYAVVALSLITGKADETMVMLAWIFVAFRAVQALIHITYNRIIPDRFVAFLIGKLTLLAMWVWFYLSVNAAAP